jgi:hypothetical protein
MAAAGHRGDRNAPETHGNAGESAQCAGNGTRAGAPGSAVAGFIRHAAEAASRAPLRARRVIPVPSAQMPGPGLPLVVVITAAQFTVYVRADLPAAAVTDLAAALGCPAPDACPGLP